MMHVQGNELRGIEWQPRDRFPAMLAHDLQTPLTAIILTATAELRRTGDAREREAAIRILSCAERMRRMTEDLLDFARSRFGGGLPVRPEKVDLADLAANVVREVEAARPGSCIRLEADGDVRGEWDPARIAQVIVNLLSNALQHGTREAPVDVRLLREPDSIRIDVVNEGDPILASDAPRLFEPFARGHSERSRRESVGLGLFIVSEIVAAHGGNVTTYSSLESGTVTFSVRLPLRSAARE